METDDIKVVQVVSHLENDFHRTVTDAAWLRRRRREKKRGRGEARRGHQERRTGKIVITIHSDEEEEDAMEVIIAGPKPRSPEVVELEDDGGDAQVAVVPVPNQSNALADQSSLIQAEAVAGNSVPVQEFFDGRASVPGDGRGGPFNLRQAKEEVRVTEENGNCDLGLGQVKAQESEGGALLSPEEQNHQSNLDTSGLPSRIYVEGGSSETSASESDGCGRDVEEMERDVEDLEILDVLKPQACNGPSSSQCAVKNWIKANSSRRSIIMDSGNGDKKEKKEKTSRNSGRYSPVMKWTFNIPVVKRVIPLSTPSSSKKLKLAKRVVEDITTNNVENRLWYSPLEATISNVPSEESGFETGSGSSRASSPFQSQGDAAGLPPPTSDVLTIANGNFPDEEQMPILQQQIMSINEKSISTHLGIGLEEDSMESDIAMPELVAQSTLEDCNGSNDDDDAMIEDFTVEEEVLEEEANEEQMEEDLREVNKKEVEAPLQTLMKKKKVRARLTENGVVILNLDKASEIFRTKYWCKLCDIYFPKIEELRSHLVLIDNVSADMAGKVTKKNEATWDLEVAKTFEHPIGFGMRR